MNGNNFSNSGNSDKKTSDGSSDHGVFTHQDDGITSQGLSDFVHLLGRNIIDTNDEDRFVFSNNSLNLEKY